MNTRYIFLRESLEDAPLLHAPNDYTRLLAKFGAVAPTPRGLNNDGGAGWGASPDRSNDLAARHAGQLRDGEHRPTHTLPSHVHSQCAPGG